MAHSSTARRVVCDPAGRHLPTLARREQVLLVAPLAGADVVDVVVPGSWDDPRRRLRSDPRVSTRVAAELAAATASDSRTSAAAHAVPAPLVSGAPASTVAAALAFTGPRVPGTPAPVVAARLPGGAWIADASGTGDAEAAIDLLTALVTLLDGHVDLISPAGTGVPAGRSEVDASEMPILPAGTLVLAPAPVARTVHDLLVAPADRIGVLVGFPQAVVLGRVDDRSVELARRIDAAGWPALVLDVAAAAVARRRRAAGLTAGLASVPR